MMRYALITVVLMSFFFISGCNLISPDPAAVMPVEIPDAYVHKAGIDDTPQTCNETMAGGWWRQFGVDELSKLIQTGLFANYDLKVLKAKADQALADVKNEKSKRGVKSTFDFYVFFSPFIVLPAKERGLNNLPIYLL